MCAPTFILRSTSCTPCKKNVSIQSPELQSQQHTTLHTTAGLLLKLSRVGSVQSGDERPDAAGSGVGGAVGGTLSSGLKKYPRAVIGDTALCRVLSSRWDVKRVS